MTPNLTRISFLIHLTRFICALIKLVFKGAKIMRNNAPCKIAGIGTIRVKIFNRTVRIFDDMRHVSDLKRNYISLRIRYSEGHKYTNESRVLKVSKCARIVMKGYRRSA